MPERNDDENNETNKPVDKSTAEAIYGEKRDQRDDFKEDDFEERPPNEENR